MSMSDELTSATLQVGTQVAGVGTHTIEKSIDVIAKLLQLFMEMKKNSAINGNNNIGGDNDKPDVKSTDLTDIKTGEVSYKKLRENARSLGDSVTVSKNGFNKEDMKYIAQKAKAYGIPVAFTNKKGKDNIYANVRTSDLDIFKNICTDMMKEKLDVKPQKLGNFKVNEWVTKQLR